MQLAPFSQDLYPQMRPTIGQNYFQDCIYLEHMQPFPAVILHIATMVHMRLWVLSLLCGT